MITARSLKALIDNLHEQELDLPIIVDDTDESGDMATVTNTKIILHNLRMV